MPPLIAAQDLARLALSGPRYTSYPPATELSAAIGAAEARTELERLGAAGATLSLYMHLPFCRSLCWYCGCNVVATRDRGRGTSYVDTLLTELVMIATAAGGHPRVTEIALGGGSPNFLLGSDLRRLIASARRWLDVAPDARLSIELDPRDTGVEQLDILAAAGCNAISIGVQDFAPSVQRAINRIQSLESTRYLITAARARGIDDVNLDIVYGLPNQTPETFADTIDAVIGLAPERIALFGYAHLPDRRPHQMLVERAGPLPGLHARAELLLSAVERLTAAGYLHIGLDHFARRGSRFADAATHGRLDRTFQGYVEHRADAIIGVGATAISTTDRMFWQNQELGAWTRSVGDGQLPVARGLALDEDDRLRRAVITRLMCDGVLDLADLDDAVGAGPGSAVARFQPELDRLAGMDELCTVDGGRIAATPVGQLLIRNVCMVFDRYLPDRQRVASFSTTV